MKPPIKFAGFEVHEAANLFRMMTDQEYSDLKSDMEKHGQILPIILYDGKLLDGRNRAMACCELGLSPKTEVYLGDDPVSFAISLNKNRRHMALSQLAAVAVDALPLYEAQARERKLKLSGTRSNPGTKEVGEKIPQPREPKATELAASAFGVNPRYIQDAKKIKEESPEAFEKLKTGEVTLQKAKRDLAATEPAKKEPKREPQKRGSYADWQKFRSLCIQLEEIIDELAELQVDAPHERIARDTASKISRKLDKAINNI